MRPTFSWFGVGLIAIGTVMLLDRLDIFYVDWTIAVWGLIGVFGATRMIEGFRRKLPARTFLGTFLFLFGMYNALRAFDVLYSRFHMFPPVLLLILGLSIVALYAINTKEWHLLIPAVAFIGLAAVWILIDLGYVYRYDVVDTVRDYWPIALILFGISLIIKRRSV